MTRPTLLSLFLLLAPLLAQDDELPPDEVADLIDRYVERGEESLRQGNYEEARLRFRKALKRAPQHPTARLGVAAAHQAVGAYAKAEAELARHLEAHPGDRAGKVARAELDLRQGRLARATETAREVMAKGGGEGPDLLGLRARLVLAEALARRGQRDEARTALDFFLDYHDRRVDSFDEANWRRDELRHRPAAARPLAVELTLVARALRHYVELSPLDNEYVRNANELLLLAQKLDPEYWEAWIERVRVTRVEREGALAAARKARDVVTPKNPELADLYTEIATSILTGFNAAEARQLAETALKVNPKQTDARAIAARVMLEDNEYATATEHLDAGLAVDPYHRDLLTLRATLELLLGHEQEFEEGMKRVLAVDPTYGEGFHLAGLVVAARQRRYDKAEKLVRRGLAIDPTNFQAHATLGIFLANLGRAEDALAALTKSQKLFPWSHPIRENFKTVLEYVTESMTDLRSEHFVYRFDPGEHDIMARFLPELMEACWADMTRRYGFVPKAPVLVEVFRKADDFSVRTLGLPGIPALGACFGGLITLDSPQALPPGKFLWASTARHEFAHVMSLQLSKGQVPRWFTEGLSVLEEKPLDTGWGQDPRFEKQVFDAYRTGTLPEIATFDAMFRGPRVAYAYYVGGLMLQFLQERAGEEGIVKALRLYGEDRPMREVFLEAFTIELEEFDTKFAAYVGQRVQRYRRVPDYRLLMEPLREKVLANPADGDSLLQLAWAYFQAGEIVNAGATLEQALRHVKLDERPLALLLNAHLARRAERPEKARRYFEAFFEAGGEDFDARMIMAAHHLTAGEEEKYVDALLKAKAAWPLRIGGRNPYALLRSHYLAKGRRAAALQILEEHARIASRSIRLRLALAREYAQGGRDEDAIRVLEEALRVTVFNRPVHEGLVPLYRAARARKKAIRSARCVVALRDDQDSDEEVGKRWLDLAEVLVEDDQKAEAKAALVEAEKLFGGDVPEALAPRLKALKDKTRQ
ncbi:MAG: tetratricopeptide repeat protein [Planctomycetota bacterium]|jgi:tetratricopeptide (TPR) repeat protein